ncbi:MAG: acyltransferase family protein [Prevotellaceae bacterium]|nr:acyltransferase family protein [Prevotellaceae bacterium]
MKIEQRIDYLDIAKAICIVLVVVGHFNPSLAPEGWHTSVDVIYTFHMPLFMFVSGFLFTKPYFRLLELLRKIILP